MSLDNPAVLWRLAHSASLNKPERKFSQSDGQGLAAATTTGGEHAATVLGGHTRAEAVHFAALTLLGLVGTEHVQHSLQIKFRNRRTDIRRGATIQPLQYIGFSSLCQGFAGDFFSFRAFWERDFLPAFWADGGYFSRISIISAGVVGSSDGADMIFASMLYGISTQIARGQIALLRSLTRQIMARERKQTSSAGRKANFFAEEWGKVRNFRFTSTAKCAILSRGTQSNPLIPAREAGKARSEPTETELPAPDRAVRLNMRNIAPFPAASDGKGAFFLAKYR